MGFQPAIEDAADSSMENVNILATGFSGSGKTTLGATAEDPLILLLEEQGVLSVKAINPRAKVVKVTGLNPDGSPILDAQTGTPITAWDHLLRTLAWVRINIGTEAFTYKTLVLDSLQDAQLALVAKLLGGRKAADDDAARLSQEDYGILGQRTLDLVRFLKKLPIDVIVITKAEEFVDGQELKVRPGTVGQMAGKDLPYAFNLVVYCYKIQGQDGGRPVYAVLTDGSSKYLVKGHPALNPIEIQNAASIISRLKGSSGAGLIQPAAEGTAPEGAKMPPAPAEAMRPGQAKREKAAREKAAKQRGLATKKEGAA